MTPVISEPPGVDVVPGARVFEPLGSATHEMG